MWKKEAHKIEDEPAEKIPREVKQKKNEFGNITKEEEFEYTELKRMLDKNKRIREKHQRQKRWEEVRRRKWLMKQRMMEINKVKRDEELENDRAKRIMEEKKKKRLKVKVKKINPKRKKLQKLRKNQNP